MYIIYHNPYKNESFAFILQSKIESSQVLTLSSTAVSININKNPTKQRIMKIKNLFLVVVFLGLVGCSSETPKIRIISTNTGAKAAEVKLADAATSVGKSLQELAKIEQATHPRAKIPSPVDPEMIGMGQLASIDWSGPIGPLMSKIADATHYKLRVLGTPPAIPILISISAKDTQLADILRDAGFQCGDKANIVVYPGTKTIELRYAKP